MKHKLSGLTSTTTAAGVQSAGAEADMSLTLQEQLARGKRADSVAEKLRQTAAQSLQMERERMYVHISLCFGSRI